MTMRRFAPAALAIVLVAGACASGDDASQPTEVGAAEQVQEAQEAEQAESQEDAGESEAEAENADDGSDEGAAEPSDDAAGGSSEAAATEPEATEVDASNSIVPAVDVVDLATGETVSLASYVPSNKPIVLWFWAPH